jgi:GH25 family lysozyme M1 (1,4-beta-N-acetylmuramidase)
MMPDRFHQNGYCEGIDVAYPQKGSINWREVAKLDWLKFCFIKTSESFGEDPALDENYLGANEAGLLCGPYHFFRFNHDAVKQADWFVSRYEKRGHWELPPVIDVESNYYDAKIKNRGGLFIDNVERVGVDRAIDAVKRFCERVEGLSGRSCVVYCGAFYWQREPVPLAVQPCWLSNYRWQYERAKENPDVWIPKVVNGRIQSAHTFDRVAPVVKPWLKWKFWQYQGDDGSLPGVKVACDRNYFDGSFEDLLEWNKLTYVHTKEIRPTLENHPHTALWNATKNISGG